MGKGIKAKIGKEDNFDDSELPKEALTVEDSDQSSIGMATKIDSATVQSGANRRIAYSRRDANVTNGIATQVVYCYAQTDSWRHFSTLKLKSKKN